MGPLYAAAPLASAQPASQTQPGGVWRCVEAVAGAASEIGDTRGWRGPKSGRYAQNKTHCLPMMTKRGGSEPLADWRDRRGRFLSAAAKRAAITPSAAQRWVDTRPLKRPQVGSRHGRVELLFTRHLATGSLSSAIFVEANASAGNYIEIVTSSGLVRSHRRRGRAVWRNKGEDGLIAGESEEHIALQGPQCTLSTSKISRSRGGRRRCPRRAGRGQPLRGPRGAAGSRAIPPPCNTSTATWSPSLGSGMARSQVPHRARLTVRVCPMTFP